MKTVAELMRAEYAAKQHEEATDGLSFGGPGARAPNCPAQGARARLRAERKARKETAREKRRMRRQSKRGHL